MRDGAWIELDTGQHHWVDEHCEWVKRKANAEKIGLSETVWNTISKMPNDFGKGPNRGKILRAVMDDGYIRVRGYGREITLEFTCATAEAMCACVNFLNLVAGPENLLLFHNARTGEILTTKYSGW